MTNSFKTSLRPLSDSSSKMSQTAEPGAWSCNKVVLRSLIFAASCRRTDSIDSAAKQATQQCLIATKALRSSGCTRSVPLSEIRTPGALDMCHCRRSGKQEESICHKHINNTSTLSMPHKAWYFMAYMSMS